MQIRYYIQLGKHNLIWFHVNVACDYDPKVSPGHVDAQVVGQMVQLAGEIDLQSSNKKCPAIAGWLIISYC